MKKLSVTLFVTAGLVAIPNDAGATVTVNRSFKSVEITKDTGYFVPIFEPDREVYLDLNEATRAPGRGCPTTNSGVLSDCSNR